jgi:hypothetical protein
MSSQFPLSTSPAPPGSQCEPAPAQARLALLCALETSLLASHEAILTRDRARLQFLTAEQAGLQRELATLGPEGSAANDPAASSALQQAHRRVLQMGRIQMALLRRAFQALRALAHLLARRNAEYVPPPFRASPARRYQPFAKET